MVINDQTLLSYVEGALSDDARLQVEAAIARSQDMGARVAALRASALPYREAFDDLMAPPVPPGLKASVLALTRGRTTHGLPRKASSANDASFVRTHATRMFGGQLAAGAMPGVVHFAAPRARPLVWWSAGTFAAVATACAVLLSFAGARLLADEPSPSSLSSLLLTPSVGNAATTMCSQGRPTRSQSGDSSGRRYGRGDMAPPRPEVCADVDGVSE
ncbi:anti-sigma factor family protein [Pandoraea norimbergensis]|uniref:Anti sigma-E protein RseA N-terminal domain-containing protein n=1 Tax=Pandoraea norimbergensis TaxID=93219 RepID=A0ABN4JP70_9BURK|nr:hypothetical protein [Pandoraea norimbergensis]ALS61617.1 hypothetical protein AT302_19405 [Pandoraea norimbergensis]